MAAIDQLLATRQGPIDLGASLAQSSNLGSNLAQSNLQAQQLMLQAQSAARAEASAAFEQSLRAGKSLGVARDRQFQEGLKQEEIRIRDRSADIQEEQNSLRRQELAARIQDQKDDRTLDYEKLAGNEHADAMAQWEARKEAAAKRRRARQHIASLQGTEFVPDPANDPPPAPVRSYRGNPHASPQAQPQGQLNPGALPSHVVDEAGNAFITTDLPPTGREERIPGLTGRDLRNNIAGQTLAEFDSQNAAAVANEETPGADQDVDRTPIEDMVGSDAIAAARRFNQANPADQAEIDGRSYDQSAGSAVVPAIDPDDPYPDFTGDAEQLGENGLPKVPKNAPNGNHPAVTAREDSLGYDPEPPKPGEPHEELLDEHPIVTPEQVVRGPAELRIALAETKSGLVDTVSKLKQQQAEMKRITEKHQKISEIAIEGGIPIDFSIQNEEMESARRQLMALNDELNEGEKNKIMLEAELTQADLHEDARLPPTVLGKMAITFSLAKKARNAAKLLREVPEGEFSSGPLFNLFEQVKKVGSDWGVTQYSRERQKFEGARLALSNVLLKDRSGAAVSNQEMERFVRELGDPTTMQEGAFRERFYAWADGLYSDFKSDVQLQRENGATLPKSFLDFTKSDAVAKAEFAEAQKSNPTRKPSVAEAVSSLESSLEVGHVQRGWRFNGPTANPMWSKVEQ